MSNSNEVNWDESIWKEINDAVVAEMFKVRTAQKVFPTTVLENDPTEIPNEVIDFRDLSIKEGQTKSFVEIYREFSLTATQVSREAQLKTCKILARMAAKELALAEDRMIFRGRDGLIKVSPEAARDSRGIVAAGDEVFPGIVKVDLIDSAREGLLGEANPKDENGNYLADDADTRKVSIPIPVGLSEDVRTSNGGRKKRILWGENTFSAVAEGIAQLTAKAQAPKFALFLPVMAYADTYVPPSDASLVTTAERIKPLVEGGFMEAVTLPPDEGLLVALAGDPTTIYVGHEATTEFVRKEGARYWFRVVERVQFVARDPRAFVLLKFDPAEAKPSDALPDTKPEA